MSTSTSTPATGPFHDEFSAVKTEITKKSLEWHSRRHVIHNIIVEAARHLVDFPKSITCNLICSLLISTKFDLDRKDWLINKVIGIIENIYTSHISERASLKMLQHGAIPLRSSDDPFRFLTYGSSQVLKNGEILFFNTDYVELYDPIKRIYKWHRPWYYKASLSVKPLEMSNGNILYYTDPFWYIINRDTGKYTKHAHPREESLPSGAKLVKLIGDRLVLFGAHSSVLFFDLTSLCHIQTTIKASDMFVLPNGNVLVLNKWMYATDSVWSSDFKTKLHNFKHSSGQFSVVGNFIIRLDHLNLYIYSANTYRLLGKIKLRGGFECISAATSPYSFVIRYNDRNDQLWSESRMDTRYRIAQWKYCVNQISDKTIMSRTERARVALGLS